MQPTPAALEHLHAITRAFPTRTLRLRRTGVGWLLPLLVGLAALAATVVIAANGLPGLHADWKLRQQGVYTDGQIDGACKKHARGLMLDCNATLRYQVDGRRYEVAREFFIVGWISDYSVRIVRSSADPAIATLDVALDRWWNRLWTAVAGLAMAIGVAVFALWQWWEARHMRLAYRRRGGTLRPALVQITEARRLARQRRHFSYLPVQPKRRTAVQTLFKRDEAEPLLIEGAYALAVVTEGAEHLPVLLDAGLTRIDLSPDERAQLLALTAA